MRKTLIQRKVVGAGGAATIEFTNIPQTYTDLYLLISGRNTLDNFFIIYPNGSSSDGSVRFLRGTGSAANSGTAANISSVTGYDARTSNTFGNTSVYIPNYTSSSAKSFSFDAVEENNATDSQLRIDAALWNPSSQAAITSLQLVAGSSGVWMQYSSASLYGVSKYNTSAAPKASGGIISYDSANDKWVHVFTASGTFTPSENLTAEYLVIAGGGGGGGGQGGGGGAGGYRSSVSGESSGGGASAESPLSLTASTNYTVTVGAGGAGGTHNGSQAASGSNSVFSTITSTGGGGAGGYAANTTNSAGLSGGSGGGSGSNQQLTSGGSGTANQGYDGGDITLYTPPYIAAGGGGAGAAAGNSNSSGSAGGDGVASSITGTSITRAGGGGAGGESASSSTLGGSGGGGVGGSTPGDGQVNTGSGGGGSSYLPLGTQGADGGSGIVIVRYSA